MTGATGVYFADLGSRSQMVTEFSEPKGIAEDALFKSGCSTQACANLVDFEKNAAE